jgi:TATA-binding protein-associated factor Taf7
MGLNKSKKLAKKSVKPAPVVEEEIEELDAVEEIEDEDKVEEIEEGPVKKSKRGTKSSKAAKTAPADEDSDDEDSDDEDSDNEDSDNEDSDNEDEISFNTDSVVKGIVSDKRNLTSAVYQVQLRLPAELEPLYKALSPRLKKALRDAFGELVRKAYDQTH